ncbi:hypothetical protein ERX27_07590 [Macrococcus brunensis]|uniref:Phage protein n=1 Tax=Macrococcus brunensis TaxID=198483 RepID=A0A4R6BCW9_9STAP|nr:hypothetical protein [Macrococcus brunensis]TDL96709.1 hypothetical protein ERX27_07590 [Macrococcus brunensis]
MYIVSDLFGGNCREYETLEEAQVLYDEWKRNYFDNYMPEVAEQVLAISKVIKYAEVIETDDYDDDGDQLYTLKDVQVSQLNGSYKIEEEDR